MPKKKPDSFPMVIQGGMLDALGINMYATLAKSMVEFVANAHDSDAGKISISIPFDKISKARDQVRKIAKQEVADNKREPFTLLLLPLPDDIEIVIRDNGHGMDPDDVENKFIPVNRKRRLDKEGKENNLMSENGRRKVMGRKGLGKLAGFGVADKITIKTKRKEDDFWTSFLMDYSLLCNSHDLSSVEIPASYSEGVIGEQGTVITLSRLRCDAVKRGKADLEHTLRQNFFGIKPEDFSIEVNDAALLPEAVEYDFTYPEVRQVNGFASGSISVPDVIDFSFDYVVKFRKPGNSLRSDQRGARIYCHNRLAAGPSLFRLPSGVHNYHGQDYLECVIQADQLDELGVDLVSTDRTQLKGESEIVIAFIDKITEILKSSLAAHYKYKDTAIERDLERQASPITTIVRRMPPKSRGSAFKLLKIIGTEFGIGTPAFEEMAPLVIDTMNAGEVLVKLIEIGMNPSDINQVANALRDLAEIEKSDALKIFRGRREGINALKLLSQRGEDEYRKTQFEGDLHALLKKYPWLIRQEYSNHLTSDESLSTVCGELAKALNVDQFSGDTPKDDKLRPDLVYLMQDPRVNEIIIVELKSPSIPLEAEHLTQLQGYIADVELWLRKKFSHPILVQGYLIGKRLPPDRRSRGATILESLISKSGPGDQWRVFDLQELIRNTELAHAEIIHALEQDLGEDHIMMQNQNRAPQASHTTHPASQEI